MSTWPITRERLGELVRFALVGGSSTLIYLGIYAACIAVGVGFVLASMVGFLFSASSGFLLHHHFTFRTRDPTVGGMARWLTLQGTVLTMNIALLAALVQGAGFNRILAQAILLPAIPVLTFLASRRLVFRPTTPQDR